MLPRALSNIGKLNLTTKTSIRDLSMQSRLYKWESVIRSLFYSLNLLLLKYYSVIFLKPTLLLGSFLGSHNKWIKISICTDWITYYISRVDEQIKLLLDKTQLIENLKVLVVGQVI